ncbi:MAG: hypothetical protein ACTSPY_12445 [Candidatus Helarchaeota archaeon]
MIEHRKYLLYYGPESWNYGFWKSIFKNPPCKKPGTPKNKQYEYEIEMIGDDLKEIYLQLIGESTDLNEIEIQLAKYKIGRIESNCSLTIICDSQPLVYLDMFKKFCNEKGYFISKRIIIPPKK